MAGTLRISGGELTIPSGIIVNADINSAAAIAVEKTQHLYKPYTNFDLAMTATPVTREEIVFVSDGVGLIRGFHALCNDTGTTADVDFDLSINGVSALSATVNITNANSDKQVLDGTLSTTVLAADDVVSISLVTTTTTGMQGPFAWVDIEEAA